MKKTVKKIIVILIIISFILVGGISIFASNSQDEKSTLESQLKELELKIALYERDVTKTQAEREALQYEVNTLKKRIDQLNTQMRQAQSTAKVLTGQIKDKEVSINITLSEINKLRSKLSENLRTIHEEDKRSLIEILVSENDLSNFFNNSLSLERLSLETRDLLGEIITLKVNLEDEKISLGRTREETEHIARQRAIQAQEVEAIRKSQEGLLKNTQQKESQQKQELEVVKKQAAEIRARLFELAGTPTSQAPTFGEAYEIAKTVEAQTGVRAAFLLAVLHQESGIGKNVGQCYLKDPVTANGINIRTGAAVNGVMKPMGLAGRKGDVDDFLIITRELGLDPFTTPVSCPIPSVGGYGGAMGPAQFIPTTWMGYRARLAAILGRPANPWNIRDAFLASGLYLSNYGAGAKTRDAEWCAAQGYFTGRKCNPNHAFYGNNVLAIADRFQQDINILNQNR
jgi:membrane-bound lytic murein transglycosylase B/outer membrane murein-binding lipoprotein Lpp